MGSEQFAYWLQGFAELTGDTPPTAEQWASIREHLQTVFKKITPAVRVAPSVLPAPPSPPDYRFHELLPPVWQQPAPFTLPGQTTVTC